MSKKKSRVVWYSESKERPGKELMKNLAVAASLVICAVMLKTGAVPGMEQMTDAVVTAVTNDTIIDDQLGKLSFVSKLFPEATLVFGQQREGELIMPVNGGSVVHAWSESEPYLAWRSASREVISSGAGVVMGVYHGVDEERIVQIKHEEIVCTYGNLQEVYVQEGQLVAAGERIGQLSMDRDCVLEVYLGGASVDPLRYMGNVQ